MRTTKGRNETIRTFAQRWRAIATQVKPAIPEEELVDLFLKTLPLEYFERLNTSGCQTFTHLIKVAERHEWALREKRIPEPSFKRQYPVRRDQDNSGEVAFVPNPPAPRKFSESTPTLGGSSGQVPRKFEAKKRPPPSFTPLPRPLSKLLPMLLEGHLVAKEPPRSNPPKFPGFDETQSCVYHMGEKGHNVDNCLRLKYKVQALIDGGLLEFDKTEPNVQQNPLPDHGRVNAIWDEGDEDKLEYVADTAKLQEVVATYLADREASREEKIECLEKLAALGILDKTNGSITRGTLSTIDISSNEFRVEADDRSLGKAPHKPMLSEKQVTRESDEESDDEEVRRRKARRADKKFLQEALERGDVVGTLGQDSGGYNYQVLYSAPASFLLKTEEIVPDGWGGMDDPVDEEELVGAIDEATSSGANPVNVVIEQIGENSSSLE